VRDLDYRVEMSIPNAVTAKGSKGLFSSLVLRHQARYDLKLWIGSEGGSAAYLPG
jgi:hypothetical protein